MTSLLRDDMDLLEALNIAVEYLTNEAANTEAYTRTFTMFTDAGRADIPRSAEIGHRQRQRVLQAIEQLKLCRLRLLHEEKSL